MSTPSKFTKSPAFQFYPKDFLSGTATMSLQEVGAYVRLLCYAWDAGSVPAEPKERARILGCARAQEKELWKKVGQKFALRGDAYINERMEDERHKQAEYRRRQSDKGKAGATARWDDGHGHACAIAAAMPAPLPVPQPNDGSSSSSSSSSSTETPKNGVSGAPARPLVSGVAHPREWGRIHGHHVTGFCDWVCLPEFVFEEFRSKSPGESYVREWAAKIRREWEGRTIGEDGLKFWRVRWSESHRTPTLSPPIRIQDILDKEAAKKAAQR